MTLKDRFQQMVRDRRQYAPGSIDWQWRTKAARTYLAMLRGVPTTEWDQ